MAQWKEPDPTCPCSVILIRIRASCIYKENHIVVLMLSHLVWSKGPSHLPLSPKSQKASEKAIYFRTAAIITVYYGTHITNANSSRVISVASSKIVANTCLVC